MKDSMLIKGALKILVQNQQKWYGTDNFDNFDKEILKSSLGYRRLWLGRNSRIPMQKLLVPYHFL